MTTLSPEQASSTATAGAMTARRWSSATARWTIVATAAGATPSTSAAASSFPASSTSRSTAAAGRSSTTPDRRGDPHHLLGPRPVRHHGAAADAHHRHARDHRRSRRRRHRRRRRERSRLPRPPPRRSASLGRPQRRPRSRPDPPDGRTPTSRRWSRRGQALPHLLSTVAAETVTPDQIARPRRRRHRRQHRPLRRQLRPGRRGCRGRRDRWSPISSTPSPSSSNREPGVVGAALAIGALNAGLIADGIHVHPEAIGVALRAKRWPRPHLPRHRRDVADRHRLTEFTLNGRKILRRDGALRLADGTLAGADLTMIDAVTLIHRTHRPPARRSPPHGVALSRAMPSAPRPTAGTSGPAPAPTSSTSSDDLDDPLDLDRRRARIRRKVTFHCRGRSLCPSERQRSYGDEDRGSRNRRSRSGDRHKARRARPRRDDGRPQRRQREGPRLRRTHRRQGGNLPRRRRARRDDRPVRPRQHGGRGAAPGRRREPRRQDPHRRLAAARFFRRLPAEPLRPEHRFARRDDPARIPRRQGRKNTQHHEQRHHGRSAKTPRNHDASSSPATTSPRRAG